jgi:hypothetical protein
VVLERPAEQRLRLCAQSLDHAHLRTKRSSNIGIVLVAIAGAVWVVVLIRAVIVAVLLIKRVRVRIIPSCHRTMIQVLTTHSHLLVLVLFPVPQQPRTGGAATCTAAPHGSAPAHALSLPAAMDGLHIALCVLPISTSASCAPISTG